MKDYNRTLEALYAIETNQHNSQDSDNSFGSDNEEKRAIRKISATEEIPNEVKNWLTETFIRGNVIKNLGKFEPGFPNLPTYGRFPRQHYFNLFPRFCSSRTVVKI